ncbi:DUF5615 family PIN-like protein [Crocosphaera watsonii]|uniref:DUF5615 domain-containing protein n=2 Tax=Crocosphaera watsonii TaxID=263511 RepID=T2JLZ5_CROWT|nr:DUF5615 family PIN-like protein [Crocosphaera watsonii]CCQ54425.1 hypothetical protein CWATWH0005_659 [Crocosphaera watsonii WH 0005]CCQ65537.1 hypothetical protein CWATWH0402_433 [Crocosphaera watsonii WH 0402]
MSIQYLIDENLPPLYQEQLRRYLSDLKVLMVGDPNAPSKGTLDPEILIWCEHHNFILVTNNRRSMPVHLNEHLGNNHNVPGIFVLRKKFTIGEIIGDLLLISQVGEPSDYQNRITYIPL